MAHKGVLSALSAIVPIANCMMAENKFMSLCDDMDYGVALLTATMNFLSDRRFKNLFKSVCIDTIKEVVQSKKMMDNDGKEYMLFRAPK